MEEVLREILGFEDETSTNIVITHLIQGISKLEAENKVYRELLIKQGLLDENTSKS